MASSCCGIVEVGELVQFGHQTNLIVWNQEKGIEHFIREAHFDTEAEDIGFIAPTPSVPELAEVDPDVFVMLEGMRPIPPNSDAVAGAAAETDSAAEPVEVVQEQDVAGYRAATLKASDSQALAEWMVENEYATTPAVEEWTQFYIDKGWYLTAFKVIGNEDGEVETGTVRMSFKTDKPFNPYYVPKDNLGGPGGLRLYFLADGIASGKVGDAEAWEEPKWHTTVNDRERNQVAKYLDMSADDLPAKMTLTTFQDNSFPNDAGDDLYFEVKKPPFGSALAAGGAVLGGLVLVGGLVYLVRRRRPPVTAD